MDGARDWETGKILVFKQDQGNCQITQLRPSARTELAVVGFACCLQGGCGEGTERVDELNGGLREGAIGVMTPSQIFLVVFLVGYF